MIKSFSLREIFTVHGQPGLWKLKSYSQTLGIGTIERLSNPKQTAKARGQDLSPVESVEISTTHEARRPPFPGATDPNIVTVATMFERLDEIYNSDPGKIQFNSLLFDKMPKEAQRADMLVVVPNADLTKLLPSHFSKILRWYAELNIAITELETTTDPYDEIPQGEDSSGGAAAHSDQE